MDIYDVFRRQVGVGQGRLLTEPEAAEMLAAIDQADPATRKDDDAEAHA
jgi:hypothetical protein